MAKARKPFISRKKRREIEMLRQRRENLLAAELARRSDETVKVEGGGPVTLPLSASVGEFSKLLNRPVVTIISTLMRNGVMAAISDRIDYDTMAVVAHDLGYEPSPAPLPARGRDQITVSQGQPGEPRPPVVAVMGHVDHGKTSLLDAIRQTKISGSEVGGITQHIGAYQAEITHEGKRRRITFLDTPGHEAFTALRSHGAQIADIAVLVVAADDGVKPQTVEAINHAKAAGAPIIVAITKADLPTANPDRAIQQLSEEGLVVEEWGGKTIFVPTSVVTGEGISQLLEYIVLVADLKNYQADPIAPPQGVVIESQQKPGLGALATLLVQNGTLRLGDILVIGRTYGRIRSMTDYLGERILDAGPGTPVAVAGLEDTPLFGQAFAKVGSEKEARALTEKGQDYITGEMRVGTASLGERRTNRLKIVLKADTQGTLEALRSAINRLTAPGVEPQIIHAAVGDITASDIALAVAGEGTVIGFLVATPSSVKKVAEREGVTVLIFKIIYEALEAVDNLLQGRVKLSKVAVEKGRLRVKRVFRTTREMQIVGGEIIEGVALERAGVTLLRDLGEVAKGRLLSLQKGPEKVSELAAGQDCGVAVQIGEKIVEGDILLFTVEEEVLTPYEATDDSGGAIENKG